MARPHAPGARSGPLQGTLTRTWLAGVQAALGGRRERSAAGADGSEGELRPESLDLQRFAVNKAPSHACPGQSSHFPDPEPGPGPSGTPGPRHLTKPPGSAIGHRLQTEGEGAVGPGTDVPICSDIWLVTGSLAHGQHKIHPRDLAGRLWGTGHNLGGGGLISAEDTASRPRI